MARYNVCLTMPTVVDATRAWYRTYYAAKGTDRNDVLSNPGVLHQELASRRALLETLRAIGARRDWWVYDIGCGGGSTLVSLAELWFQPERLRGIDIQPDRIAEGRKRFPSLRLECGDAQHLPVDDHSYDVVMASTMFVQITDEAIARRIASEMLRVARRWILILDWRYDGGRAGYRAVTAQRIQQLFGKSPAFTAPAALVPPVGRFLSRYAPPLYALTQAAVPPLVGQVAFALRAELKM